jgi:hypothetical protein
MHQAPWTQWLTTSLPSKRDKINSKVSQSHTGGELMPFASGFQSYRNTAVLCIYRRILATRVSEHQKKVQSYWNFGG